MSPSPMDDQTVERLLEQKIIEGYTLLDDACPSCSYPVVQLEKDIQNDDASAKSIMIVPRVPFCVACNAHVVYKEEHLAVLDENETAKHGTVLLALPSSPRESYPFPVHNLNHSRDAPSAMEQRSTRAADPDASRAASLQVGDKEIEAVAPSSPMKSMFQAFQNFFQGNRDDETATYDDDYTRDDTTLERNPVREIHLDDTATIEDELTVDEPHHHTGRTKGDPLPNYSERRELGTKIISKKLHEGYMLLPRVCDRCELPLMEKDGLALCVVCPSLGQPTANKKTAMTVRNRRVMELAKRTPTKSLVDDATIMTKDDSTLSSRTDMKLPKNSHKGKTSPVSAIRKSDSKTTTSKPWHVKFSPPSLVPPSAEEKEALAKEESRLLEEIRKAESARQRYDQAHFEIKQAEEQRDAKEFELSRAIQRQNQKISYEAQRLEELQKIRSERARQPGEGLLAALSAQEQRAIIEQEIKLRKEIEEAEAAREEAEIEARRLADDKRALEEATLIKRLEEQAKKAQEQAEEALARARRAMDDVSYAQKSILAKTIAEADASLIAEVETINRQQAEDYHEVPRLQTAEELRQERWETLRTEGRAIMTRRMLAGWTLLPELCCGEECHNSPLLSKGAERYCVVCGGCGTGDDGAYRNSDEYKSNGRLSHNPLLPSSLVEATPHDSKKEKEQQDFREAATKEIGKRMLEGWTLLDMSCPSCDIPLMTNQRGVDEVCVACGVVGHIDRPTTIPDMLPQNRSRSKLERVEEQEERDDDEGEEKSLRSAAENDQGESRSQERTSRDAFPSIKPVPNKPDATNDTIEIEKAPLKNATVRTINTIEQDFSSYSHIIAARSSIDTKGRSDPPAIKGDPSRTRRAKDVDGVFSKKSQVSLPPRPDFPSKRPQTGMSDDDSGLGLFVPTNVDLNDEAALKELISSVRAMNERVKVQRNSPGGATRLNHLPSPGMTAATSPWRNGRGRGIEPPELRRKKSRSPRDITGTKKCIVYGGPVGLGMTGSLSFEDGSVNTEAIDDLLYKIEKTQMELAKTRCDSDNVKLTKLLSNLHSAAEAMQKFDSRICGYGHVSETTQHQ